MRVVEHRKLIIDFARNGDVDYVFERHSGAKPLSSYVVEYPADRVLIRAGFNVDLERVRRETTSEGYLRLRWDDPGTQDWDRQELQYTKQGMLESLRLHPPLWRYTERIRVKAPLGLWLGGPGGVLSAVKGRSSACFISSQKEMPLKPRELSEIVFRENGVLAVDWLLELHPGAT